MKPKNAWDSLGVRLLFSACTVPLPRLIVDYAIKLGVEQHNIPVVVIVPGRFLPSHRVSVSMVDLQKNAVHDLVDIT
jgi:hypothetical protein